MACLAGAGDSPPVRGDARAFVRQSRPASYADKALWLCLRQGASDREVHVPGRGTAARVMPVQRIEMTTQDMAVIADLMNERYAEHRARFWCDDPARVDAGVRTVTAGPLEAALVRLRGFHYQAEVSPPDAVLALGLLAGTGTMAFGQDQVSLA